MAAGTTDTPQERATRYRKRAAELRHLAEALPAHSVNREQLVNLAEDFEELADSLSQTPLGN